MSTPPDPSRCPAIFGVEGAALSDREWRFFEEKKPIGFILFARNIDIPHQVRELISDLKQTLHGAPCLVLIDQEGGRVARLRPPHWPDYPPAADFGALYASDPEGALRAVRLDTRLIADDLAALGINVDCLPVLDLPVPGSHDVIGNRAYGTDPEIVAAMGRAACEGLMAGGVLPVIKHMPGHGRAQADSHKELPRVSTGLAELRETDFAPFRALADMPIGMTGHILFEALDAANCATTSRSVIEDIIRGDIGFDGLLLSDDLNMEAMAGTLGERAAAAQQAGCDIALHCNGVFEQMQAVVDALGPMSGATATRIARVFECLHDPEPFERVAAESERDRLLATV